MENGCVMQRKWFITENNEIRWIDTIVREKNGDDLLLVVSMENPYNSPDTRNSKIEWLHDSQRYESLKECQFEIIRRERFEKK